MSSCVTCTCESVRAVRQSFPILLEAVPPGLPVEELKRELAGVQGVLGFHELHISSLTSDVVLSSVHLSCDSAENYASIATRVKGIFHAHGIHTATIQPEFGHKVLLQVLSTILHYTLCPCYTIPCWPSPLLVCPSRHADRHVHVHVLSIRPRDSSSTVTSAPRSLRTHMSRNHNHVT